MGIGLHLTAFALVTASILEPAFAQTQPDEAHWLPPGSTLNSALTGLPKESLLPEGRSFLAGLGRLYFRSPSLLGTRARELGLSCNTCHTNGAVNARFFVPGLSDRPGNVDARHGFWSFRGEDGVDRPLNIPSLRGVRWTAPYGRDGRFSDLRSFTRHVIVVEFGGPEPQPVTLDALVAYQQALALTSPRIDPPPESLPNGKLLFRRDCASCHVPSAAYADGRQHDVGTGGLYDTPTLLGTAESAPYLHDGRADSLEEAIDHFIGYLGLSYKTEERAALTDYLRSLGSDLPPKTKADLARDLDDIRGFADLLKVPLLDEDAGLAEDITYMIRLELGRVNRRFAGPEHDPARTLLAAWARGLGEISARATQRDFAAARDALSGWIATLNRANPILDAAAATSLYPAVD